MADDILTRLRAICLALPEATEEETWGDPTFRVRAKIFAMPKQGDGRYSLLCKAPAGVQPMLIGADPERFFFPRYVGPKGWIGIRLDVAIDWDEITDFITDSYRIIAPKRLIAQL